MSRTLGFITLNAIIRTRGFIILNAMSRTCEYKNSKCYEVNQWFYNSECSEQNSCIKKLKMQWVELGVFKIWNAVGKILEI